jgi:hypothetical protein
MEKIYKIYHPMDGINHNCKISNCEYQLIGQVKANSLEQAFIYSQAFSTQWESTNNRSTSVGDIVSIDNEYYMVKGAGFRQMNHPVLNRITLTKEIL